MEEQYAELFLAYAAMAFIVGGVLIWVIFIRNFIRRAGVKPAFALFNWSPIFDHRKARAIAKKVGRVPWFLRLFEIMFAAALLIIILLMVRVALQFG